MMGTKRRINKNRGKNICFGFFILLILILVIILVVVGSYLFNLESFRSYESPAEVREEKRISEVVRLPIESIEPHFPEYLLLSLPVLFLF